MENGNVAATKADLEAFEARVTSKISSAFAAKDQRFLERMDAREQRMLDRMGCMIEDSGARLLQAFCGFAESTNQRLNQMDGNIAIFLSRLGTIEDRLMHVEKRLNIPPVS
jgi:hypothetical protein